MLVGDQKNEMWKGAKGRRPQGKTAIHSRAWDVVTAPRRAQEIEMGGGGVGSLSTAVDSGTSTVHWISEPTHLPKGWVGEPLVLLLGWRVRGQKHVIHWLFSNSP